MALYASTNFLLPVIIVAAVGSRDKENWLGILQFVSGLVSIIFGPLIGQWSDRTRSKWGRRVPWVFAGAAAGAVGMVLSAVNMGGWPLLLAWTIAQFGFQCSTMTIMTVIPERVEENKRGLVSAFYGFGVVLATMLSGVVIARFTSNPLMGMVVCSVVMVIGAVLFAVLIPYRDNRSDPRPAVDEGAPKKSVGERIAGFFRAFRYRDFRIVWISIACLFLGYQIIHSREMYFIEQHFGMNASKAAGTLACIVAIQGIITVVGIIVSGPLSDRFGRKPFVLISGIGIAASLAVTAFTPSVPVFEIVYGGVFGLALGILNGVVSPVTADALPSKEEVGKDMGLINLSQLIPQALGAPLGSLILLLPVGNYTVMLLLGAALALVGGVLILTARKIR